MVFVKFALDSKTTGWFRRENPIQWMRTRGTPILGTPQIQCLALGSRHGQTVARYPNLGDVAREELQANSQHLPEIWWYQGRRFFGSWNVAPNHPFWYILMFYCKPSSVFWLSRWLWKAPCWKIAGFWNIGTTAFWNSFGGSKTLWKSWCFVQICFAACSNSIVYIYIHNHMHTYIGLFKIVLNYFAQDYLTAILQSAG